MNKLTSYRAFSYATIALTLAAIGTLTIAENKPVSAQLTPDNTLGTENSIVTPQQLRDLIQGGAIRGNALFHSFDEFNVGDGGSVFFDLQNNTDILSIFTRVTGGNVSNILGTLGVLQDALNSDVLGNANLFLLNPNGITFGANASLQLNGSFFATTADGFEFDNFTFSASGEEAPPPLLTVSVPRFLSFRDNPGDIAVNQSNLTVNQEQNLSLVGGNVTVEGGQINAPGGRIELAGMFVAGNVNLSDGFSLIFPDAVVPDNFQLANTNATDTGKVTINAGTLNLSNGVQIVSQRENFGSRGGITINATDSVNVTSGSQMRVIIDRGGSADGIIINSPEINVDGRLNGNSGARSLILARTDGASFFSSNTGNLELNTDIFNLSNGAELKTLTFGNGSVGDIDINAEDAINITTDARLTAQVQRAGNVGNILLTSPQISMNNGRILLLVGRNPAPRDLGIGNANDQQNQRATGDVGRLEIDTTTLDLDEQSRITAQTWGSGNIGNSVDGDDFSSIIINAEERVTLNNRSQIFSQTRAEGNFGDIAITTPSLSLNNNGIIFSRTGLNFQANASQQRNDLILAENNFSQGNVGNIILNVGTLSLTHSDLNLDRDQGSKIQAQSFGVGTAGDIIIRATEGVFIRSDVSSSQNIITSNIGSVDETVGNRVSGDVIINTSSLFSYNSLLNAKTTGNGNGGTIRINTSDSISLENNSQIAASSSSSAVSGISAVGDSGSVVITAGNSISLTGNSGVNSGVVEEARGNGGNITIQASNLNINDSIVQASTASLSGNSDAGNITIDVSDTVTIDGVGSGLFAVNGGNTTGNSGSITIDSEQIITRNGGLISVNTQGSGLGGDINITSNTLTLDDGRITANTANDANGNITLNISDYIWLLNGNGTLDDQGNSIALISANARGNGGNITIGRNLDAEGNVTQNTVALIATPGQDSDITANSTGSFGGTITIGADAVFNIQASDADFPNRNDITATSQLGPQFSGQVTFTTPETNPGQETIEQPEEVVDSSDIISQSACYDFGGESQLANTGRGGVPQIPGFIIRNSVVDVELVDEVLPAPPSEAIKPHHRTDVTFIDSEGEEFKPAMGAVLLPNGMVEFVDYNPAEVYRDMYAAAGCSN